MRKITKKIFVHISQTDNIIILMKDRDSRGGGIITYHKSCVNLTRRLDFEHEHVESMWYELKTKLHNILLMLQWKMDNIFSFAILDVPPGPGFISTSPDNKIIKY
jgi:hypothetical protein